MDIAFIIFMLGHGAFTWWYGSETRQSAARDAEMLPYIEAELSAALHELEQVRENHGT